MAVARILYRSFYWKGFQFLSSFLVNLVLVRALQSSVSGEFYSLLYLLSLAVNFFSFGMDIGLNYYLSRKQISPATDRVLILGALALALSVCLPLVYLFYEPGRFPDISRNGLLAYTACLITGGLLTTLSSALFTAREQNHLPSKASFIINCLLIALTLLFTGVLRSETLIKDLFNAYFLFSLLQGLFLFAWAWQRYGNTSSGPVTGGIKTGLPIRPSAVLRFSLAAFIANFIFFGGARLYIYLLPYRVSTADQGNYIQAFKIVEYLGIAASFIYYPFMNLVAGREREKMNALLLFLLRLSNTGVLLFAILALATGPWLFPFLFGPSFERMYAIFLGFLPGLFAVCSSTFFTAYYFGTWKLKYNLVSAAILLLSMGALYFPFSKVGGLEGAALAFSCSALLSFVYDMVIFRKYVRYSFADLLLLQKKDIDSIRVFLRQVPA
jgi:O-antigen/teichoic acid export membrane protein